MDKLKIEEVKLLAEQGRTWEEIASILEAKHGKMEMIGLLAIHGLTERQIAKFAGIANSTVHWNLEKIGIRCTGKNENKDKLLDTEKVEKLCLNIGFKYISGYEGKRSVFTVECLSCEKEQSIRGAKLYNGTMYCEKCSKFIKSLERFFDSYTQIKSKREAEKAEREGQKAIKAMARFIEKAEIKEAKRRAKLERENARRTCECCGAEYRIADSDYNSEKYCSSKCQRRVYDRRHSQVRDSRKYSRRHDTDITLEKLFKRDKGICYICDGKCDWNDMEIVDGVYYAGNNYPSIDHVKALSKGGTDTWDNIKLAHRICNSYKGDRAI